MEVLSCVGVLALLGAYVVIQPILSGWALTHLWRWFIVPQFGVSELSIAEAIGISLVVSYLTYHPVETKDDRSDNEKYSAMIVYLLRPLITLAVGWVVHQFV